MRCACASTCARQLSLRLVGRRDCAARCAASSACASACRAAHCSFCAFSSRQARAARVRGPRPRSGCALRAGSLPARRRPARPGAGAARRRRHSAPGAAFPARPRRGAARRRALRAPSIASSSAGCTRCSSLGGIAVLQEPELVLLQRRPAPAAARYSVATSACCFQLVQVGVQLAQDVVDPRQVLARVLQAAFGFAAALLVLGHAGGFFEEQAQFLGARFDDAADRALADDGVGARAEAGAQEHVLHVAAAHRLVVDVVAGARRRA